MSQSARYRSHLILTALQPRRYYAFQPLHDLQSTRVWNNSTEDRSSHAIDSIRIVRNYEFDLQPKISRSAYVSCAMHGWNYFYLYYASSAHLQTKFEVFLRFPSFFLSFVSVALLFNLHYFIIVTRLRWATVLRASRLDAKISTTIKTYTSYTSKSCSESEFRSRKFFAFRHARADSAGASFTTCRPILYVPYQPQRRVDERVTKVVARNGRTRRKRVTRIQFEINSTS